MNKFIEDIPYNSLEFPEELPDDWGQKQQYQFNEKEIVNLLMDHIDRTYEGHYVSNDAQQTIGFIMKNSKSLDYLKGNVIKYVSRYGKKDGMNKKDLLKAMHYLVWMYYFSDQDQSE